MAEAKDIGRFKYIEPTNMNLNLPDNAITFPYEDYDIGVKLEVSIPDRFSCGRPDGNTIMFSSNNGTLEFFGGTGANEKERQQGYLTTSFTDISSNNVDRGNRECLGIESINISYQQWFYPIIDIKFVDIRGASLFMPQEKALQTTVQNGNENITQVNSGSFFKAIFACPSPIFKLTVMGFYGKSVTFNLKMESFQSEFDSENGNFVANVKFIGNMYGVYTEIPLQYLAVAPYADKEYWDRNVENRIFKYDSGEKMLTFPEFWKTVEQMERSGEKEVEKWKDNNGYNKISIRKSRLVVFKETFERIFSGWEKIKYNNNTFYFNIFDNSYGGLDYNEISGFYENIKDFTKEFDEYTNYFSMYPFKPSEIEIDTKYYYSRQFGKYYIYNGVIYDYNTTPIFALIKPEYNGPILPTEQEYTKTVDNLSQTTIPDESIYGDKLSSAKEIKNGTGRWLFQFNGEIYDEILKAIEDEETKSSEMNVSLQEYKVQILNQLIGFDLNIGNIFKMIFAHLDTFIHLYYDTLDNIERDKKDGKRSLSSFGISHDNSDIPDNIREVPPFPLVYGKSKDNTDKEEVKWLEDVCGRKDETILVKKLIAASHNYLSAATDAQNIIKNYSGERNNDLNPSSNAMIPVRMYDFRINNGFESPYVYAVDNDYDKYLQKIQTIFALRCIYAMYLYSNEKGNINNNDIIEYISWAEALNLRKAIGPKMTNDLITKLKIGNTSEIEKGVEEFIKYLYGSVGTPYWKGAGNNFITTINKDSAKYSLIENDGDLVLPLKYNMQEIIDDVQNGKITDNKEYLHLSVESANTDCFKVYPDNIDFFNEVKDGLYTNANGYRLPVKEKEINTFFNVFKDKNVYDGNIYTNYINKVEDNWIYPDNAAGAKISTFTNLDVDSGQYYASFVTYNLKQKSEDVDIYNTVYYGDVNNEKSRYGCFHSDFYKQQSDDLAKAYCFLFSVITKNDSNISLLKRRNIGKNIEFLLLQEGAYYWRKTQENDPIITNNINKRLTKDKLPIRQNNNTRLYFVSTTDDEDGFITWEQYGGKEDCSETRINELINRFKKFANSRDFNSLKNYLEKEHTSKDKEYETIMTNQKIFLNIISKQVLIIDNSRRPDNKDIPDKFNLNEFKNIYKGFLNNLNNIYVDNAGNTTDAFDDTRGNQLEIKTGVINDVDLNTSTYLVLKDLYDKYFSNMSRELFILDSEKSEFKKFLFMDSYYNDISNKLMVNSSFITDLIKDVTFNSSEAFNMPKRLERGVSVYEFMSEICQFCQLTFLALPQRFDVSSPKYMENMFTPHLYKDLETTENDGCYIGLYSYRPSQQLDIEGDMYAYKNDGFDIKDENGNVLPSALKNLEINNKGNFTAIPAFGVTYAKQNQSLFKRVSLTTSNQQTTEQSIFATMDVSSKGNEGPRESTLFGQDLYRVFSSYAYQCTVEMMGDIQIMPLMYFQLNNVSMWHGAYMIISVEHTITAGDMTTKFTGVRVSKKSVPLVDARIIFTDDEGNRYNLSNEENTTPSEWSNGPTQTTTSYVGKGATGGNYTNPVIFDDTAGNYVMARYESEEQKNKEKLNATWAVRSRFTATPQIAGYCARWTYNLADSFVRGTRQSEPVKSGVSGGWGAVDPGCHEAIKKLGYTLIYERHNISGPEIVNLVKNKLKDTYKYGDVMFYWSEKNDSGNNDLKHHAQFYVGDAYMPDAVDYSANVLGYENATGRKYCEFNRDSCGWVTSTLNNYCTPFVYGRYASNDGSVRTHLGNTWHILLYRCSRLIRDEEKEAPQYDRDGNPIINKYGKILA